MKELQIQPGYSAPVYSEDGVDNYSIIDTAVTNHNVAAQPGEPYWGISLFDSVYTVYEYGEVPEPEPDPEPVEPTIDEIKSNKLDTVSDTCNQLICDGIDVELSSGKKHFSLDTIDQSNIDSIFNAVTLGVTAYPYHADGEPCMMFSVKDIIALYVAYKTFVTTQTTYCNALRQWIKRESDKDAVSKIEYGNTLPDDLAKRVNEILEAANEQVQNLAGKLVNAVSAEN